MKLYQGLSVILLPIILSACSARQDLAPLVRANELNHSQTQSAVVEPQFDYQAPAAKSVSQKIVSHKIEKTTSVQFTAPWLRPVRTANIMQDNTVGAEGLNFIVSRTTPVLAAQLGKVVYCGDSIQGYGDLVIIQHANGYLSAYSHLDQILVKEGDTVKKGQKIAKIGVTSQQTAFHFEIRRDGKVLNPSQYTA